MDPDAEVQGEVCLAVKLLEDARGRCLRCHVRQARCACPRGRCVCVCGALKIIKETGGVAPLAECSPSMHRPGFYPQHHINCARWYSSLIPALRGWRQEDQELKVILGDVGGFRLAWAIRDPVSTNKTPNQK